MLEFRLIYCHLSSGPHAPPPLVKHKSLQFSRLSPATHCLPQSREPLDTTSISENFPQRYLTSVGCLPLRTVLYIDSPGLFPTFRVSTTSPNNPTVSDASHLPLNSCVLLTFPPLTLERVKSSPLSNALRATVHAFLHF